MALSDPLPLASALLGCRSVNGEPDGGALGLLATRLEALGFAVTNMPFGPTDRPVGNLHATIGSGGPHLCFCGHTDVVPPGDLAGWSVDPFAGTVRDGVLIGRGACDMKGAIAAFVAAAEARIARGLAPGRGTLSLVVTGDEEGEAVFGTAAVVAALAARGALPDFCLVGEPSNAHALGDAIRIGRRGSFNAVLRVHGVQGHVAYPERADNPLHRMAAILAELAATALDDGTAHFAPSGLQITSVDTGNGAHNVIPARAEARLNIRFNDRHDGAGLARRIEAVAARHARPDRVAIEWQQTAAPFVTPPAAETVALAGAVERVTGRTPMFDTGGGTSDARFFAPHCRVAEFGLVGRTMHAVDEQVPVADLRALAAIYADFLDGAMP